MSYYLDTIDIEKTTASETYSKVSGKLIELPAGSKKNRLKFQLQSDDTSKAAANVYAEVIGKGFFECSKSFILSIMSMMHLKFLKTTYKGKTIYINMNSLANRLGIKVDKTYSDEAFNAALKKQFETVRETEKKIDTFFQEITKARYTENGNKLKTADGKSSISKTHFRKLLGLTAFSKFNFKQKQESSYLLKDGTILFLKKEENQEWPLLTLFTKNVLGSGSFGKVLTVQELSMGRISVAKLAYGSFFYEDLKNEDLILSRIFNNNSNPVGIQRKPYSLFNFRLKDIDYFGYVAPKYDCSLSSIIQQLKTDEKIESTRQLLKGLKELEKQQISHRDIKPENCLFQRKSDASIECVIADFGGAIDLSKSPELLPYGTPFYQKEEDSTAFRSLCKQLKLKKTIDEKNKLSADLTKLLLRRDVYAMGVTLAILLEDSQCSKNLDKLCSLIKQMLEVSWEKRISASESLDEFEKIFPPSPS